jgi:hypothetical protein
MGCQRLSHVRYRCKILEEREPRDQLGETFKYVSLRALVQHS